MALTVGKLMSLIADLEDVAIRGANDWMAKRAGRASPEMKERIHSKIPEVLADAIREFEMMQAVGNGPSETRDAFRAFRMRFYRLGLRVAAAPPGQPVGSLDD